ncbi:MAG: hypothetical protein QG581_443 [Patescibacteria group bacterium]|nr:hypothetical protein [Patescibacteria group bacterium]
MILLEIFFFFFFFFLLEEEELLLEVTVGAVIVKEVTARGVLGLLEESVAVIVQFVWVPTERVEKVMVLLPDVAVVVDEVQSPP